MTIVNRTTVAILMTTWFWLYSIECIYICELQH